MSSQNSQVQQSPSKNVTMSFICQESLDPESSDAFKEPLPNAWDLHREYIATKSKEEKERLMRFKTELDPEDVKLVNELGHLSADKLMDYVRSLQSSSLALGEEEAAQFARAKLLKILDAEI